MKPTFPRIPLLLSTAVLLLALVSGCATGGSAVQPSAAAESAVPPDAPAAAGTGYPIATTGPAALPAADLPATAYPVGTAAAATEPAGAANPAATANPPVSSNNASAPTISLVTPPEAFDGARAYADVEYQVSLGPRVPGSEAHANQVQWMQDELAKSGWTVEVQEFTRLGHQGRNIIAKRGSGKPWTIIGAHFDTRMVADQDSDPSLRSQPVPGANDGASGVAVLTELGRVLPKDLQGEVWLTFFDLEDQGSLPEWDWILGSRALAESLTGQPDAVMIVDMIGDADLNIYKERNSDPQINEEVWSIAAQLGHEQRFIREERWTMTDDHTPFLEKGIRAVDLIDFDYPYWHTAQDTPDKVSAQSLQAVGDTVLHWLMTRHGK